jgi:hypothetical protein
MERRPDGVVGGGGEHRVPDCEGVLSGIDVPDIAGDLVGMRERRAENQGDCRCQPEQTLVH